MTTKLQQASTLLAEFLADNTDEVFEELPRVDTARGLIEEVIETNGIARELSTPEHNGRTFDAVEVSTCVDRTDYGCERITEQFEYDSHKADDPSLDVIYSVYGHVDGEGVECLADCATQADAQLIGRALAALWGVEVADYSFTPQQG